MNQLPVLNPFVVIFIMIAVVTFGVAVWYVYDTIQRYFRKRKAEKIMNKEAFLQKYRELEGIIYLDKKKRAKDFVRDEIKKLAVMPEADREHCEVITTQWMRKYFNEKP